MRILKQIPKELIPKEKTLSEGKTQIKILLKKEIAQIHHQNITPVIKITIQEVEILATEVDPQEVQIEEV